MNTLTKAGNQFYALDTWAQEAVRSEAKKAGVLLGAGLLYHVTRETINSLLGRTGDIDSVAASVVEYSEQTGTGHVMRDGEWHTCELELAKRFVTAAASRVLADSKFLSAREKRAIVSGKLVRG